VRKRAENLVVAAILAAGAVGVGWAALPARGATPCPHRPAEPVPTPAGLATPALHNPAPPEEDWAREDPDDEDLVQRESAPAACRPAGRGDAVTGPAGTEAWPRVGGRDGVLRAIDNVVLII